MAHRQTKAQKAAKYAAAGIMAPSGAMGPEQLQAMLRRRGAGAHNNTKPKSELKRIAIRDQQY